MPHDTRADDPRPGRLGAEGRASGRTGLYLAAVALVAFAVMLGSGQQGREEAELTLDVSPEWVHLLPPPPYR